MYNERIEELNKRRKQIYDYYESIHKNSDSDVEIDEISGKIELLNQLRLEAIEEVKELTKHNNAIRFQVEYGSRVRNQAVINYLIKKWNISEEMVK